MIDIGKRIVQLRLEKGLTQYSFDRISDVTQGALSQYESGRKTPSIDTLERICRALGVTLSEFFQIPDDDRNEYNAVSPAETELLQFFRGLRDVDKQKMLRILSIIQG